MTYEQINVMVADAAKLVECLHQPRTHEALASTPCTWEGGCILTILACRKWRQKHQKFKVILNYALNRCNSVSKSTLFTEQVRADLIRGL